MLGSLAGWRLASCGPDLLRGSCPILSSICVRLCLCVLSACQPACLRVPSLPRYLCIAPKYCNCCAQDGAVNFQPHAADNCYEPRSILVPSTTFAAMAATSSINNGTPHTTLTATFLASKTFLFAIAAGSRVGPTYDTSSGLLVPGSTPTFLTRLSSWDAIYFLRAAERGYLFEQEWAFGSALPNCISLIIRGNARSSCLPSRPGLKTKSKL